MQCFLHFYEYEKKKRLEAKRRTFLFTDKKWRSSGKAIKDGSWKNGKTARTSTDGTGWRRIAKNGREFFSSLSSFVVVGTIWGTTTGRNKVRFWTMMMMQMV
jgi:hypothetical protein